MVVSGDGKDFVWGQALYEWRLIYGRVGPLSLVSSEVVWTSSSTLINPLQYIGHALWSGLTVE